MDSSSVQLRVRYKSDQQIVHHLKTDSTCDELKHAVSLATGLKSSILRILTGFPPKAKDLANAKQTLSDMGIKNGDMLIVEALSVDDILKKKFHGVDNCPPLSGPSGMFMKKVVPADNSCLFTSIYFIVSEGIFDASCAKAIRKIVAEVVRSDRTTYTEAVLGKSNKDYCRWILNDDSWGGAIELSILSSFFGLELAVVDAQSGRIDRFGEDCAYPARGFLFFNGIHYDPLILEEPRYRDEYNSVKSGIMEIRTVFASTDERIMEMARELGEEAKQAGEYTDVQQFVLRCLVCNTGLTGQHEALQHAKDTGHSNFNEVS